MVLLVAVVAVVVLPTWAPASARTVPVVVAARDLAPGEVLDAADLRTVEVAEALAPPRLSIGDAVGARLTTAVAHGAPLDGSWLLDAADPRLEPGDVALVVPVDRTLVTHLTAGSQVRVITSTPDPSVTVSTEATVVEIPETAGQGGVDAGITTTGAEGAATIVIAVAPGDADAIAFATHEGWVALAILG